jgi:phosphinothricin acetyltransferase
VLDLGRTGEFRLLLVNIRALVADDWPAVEAIYREGIDAGNATFEVDPPTWDVFDAGKVRDARLVAVDDDGAVVGWAAASPVSSRDAYRGVIEHSVYVAQAVQGQGIGRELLRAFLDAVEAAGYWMVQSSIFPENTASLTLHERAGFRTVGRRTAIALMTCGPHAGAWRDTVLVEWRSTRNGQP